MPDEDIVSEVAKYPARYLVITGGEPSLQVTYGFVDALHGVGKKVAVETNGTQSLPQNIDWITLSPKDAYVGVAIVGAVVSTDGDRIAYVEH